MKQDINLIAGRNYVFQRVKKRWEIDLSRLASVYSIEEVEDISTRSLRGIIKGQLWGTSEKTVRLFFPKTIWDHIKSKMPKWFIKRYPVQYTEVLLSAQVLFPDLARDQLQLGHETLTVTAMNHLDKVWVPRD